MLPSEQDPDHALVIAIPVTGGRLCAHFGHSEWFALFTVDSAARQILGSRQLEPPLHQPGALPRWLRVQGAGLIIAGGMGRRAQNIFAEQGIEVIVGAPPEPPEALVKDYLEGKLRLGENLCDH